MTTNIRDYQPTAPPETADLIRALLDVSDTKVQRGLLGACLCLMWWGEERELFSDNLPESVAVPAELFKELLCIKEIARTAIVRAAKIKGKQIRKKQR